MKDQYLDKYRNTSIEDWMWNHQRNIHFKMKYRGMNMQKNPCDLWIYQNIIHTQKPDFVIEIGAAGGGSAQWICDQLETFGHGQLISIDINQSGNKAEHKRIIKITGSSQDKDIVYEVWELCKNSKFVHLHKKDIKCLIIHDGSHLKVDIKEDFRNYSPLVNIGSYFIIEDGIMDIYNWKDKRTGGQDCGLYAGIEIAKENDNWEIDEEMEKYIITYNPQGFLRRVK